MGGSAAMSFAGFTLVWSLLCLLAGALVTDAMLRASAGLPGDSAEPPDGA